MQISTCLIGEDSLVIQCGNILLSQNHTIEVVVSPLKKVQEWAKAQKILVVSDIRSLLGLQLKRLNYIFSIVNSYILPDEILQVADCAINYHDSLLPRYAGLNATSWAILNNEKIHGVTWHIINNQIDAGAIVKQSSFVISKKDTAISLNLKCYEHAIKSFRELINEIENNKVIKIPQRLQDRTYYGTQNFLPNFGFIDWKNFSSTSISRMNRALTFGHYNNHLGTLKIYLNNTYLIVVKLKIVIFKFVFRKVPGKIIKITDKAIYVTTVDKIIKIKKLLSADGEEISINKLIKKYNLYVGFQFPSLCVNDLSVLEKHYLSALASEQFWVKTIAESCNQHAVFSIRENTMHAKFVKHQHKICLKEISPNKSVNNEKNVLFTAILIYLFRLNNYEKYAISLSDAEHKNFSNVAGNLLSSFVPLCFNCSPDSSLQEVLLLVDELLKKVAGKKTYFQDIKYRHVALENEQIHSCVHVSLTGEAIDKFLLEDVSICFYIADDSITIHYKNDAHISPLIENISQHFIGIIENLINFPHEKVNKFCFLTKKEKHQLLSVWSQGKSVPIKTKSLVSQFENVVRCYADEIAVMCGEKSISYKELWDLSEKVACCLRDKNISEQIYVGIYLSRSIEMIIVILGILKVNAVYIPLDVKYPLLKTVSIIKKSGIKIIFTQEYFSKKLVDCAEQQQIDLITIEAALLADKTSSMTVNYDKDLLENLAYVIYTSGTTGEPKGVMVTHKNVLNYSNWFLDTTQFDNTSIVDFSSSIAFDLSVPCTISPLLRGGKIAICEEETKVNPRNYLQFLEKYNVTHVEMTPGYLELLLNYPEEIKKLSSLKCLLLGADTVSKIDVEKWLALCPKHQIVNEYGPTETTVAVTSYFVKETTALPEASVPIGRPGYNTSCYVLDKYENICPIGMRGELYIGGDQVAKGYYKNDQMTKMKFVSLKINDTSEVLYKSGDVTSWISDGNLQFFERNDNQVKIQGYRVDLSEIEAQLLNIRGIHQAIVALQNEESQGKYLRAYIVGEKEILNYQDVKKYLISHLPKYMIPREFCMIDHVPLRENEKIDYRALTSESYYFLDDQSSKTYKNISSIENIIKNIWQNAFHNNSLHIEDNFFDVGGDSLIALQIITEIQRCYGISISLHYLFEHPTISLLAKKIQQLVDKKKTSKITLPNQLVSFIELSKGVQKTPLFLIHPVGGTIFWYKKLASYFQGEYTIIGIQNNNDLKGNAIFSSIEKMAAYYLNEIYKIYSGEKFYLGGASFGATLAFEMANQLTKANKKVEFIGLFDGWANYSDELMQKNAFELLSRVDHTLYVDFLQKKVKKSLLKLEEKRKKILKKYQIPSLNLNVNLFKADELWPLFQAIEDPLNGWGKYVSGEIICHKVPGSHETMFFDSNVVALAMALKQQLMVIK